MTLRRSPARPPAPVRSALLRPVRGLALAAALLAPAGCLTVNVVPGPGQGLEERRIQGESGPKILLVEIDGPITSRPEEQLFGPDEPSTVGSVREQLDRARRDDDVAAVLLRIDTPGGGATASEILYRDVLRFKQERGVPVVAQLMSLATSGGYYVAMAADEVVAHPTTVTGSIGVLFVGVEFSGLMDKLGISDQTLTGGEQKDAMSPLRPMTPAERSHMQAVVDDLHARFKSVVAEGRPDLSQEEVEALGDGRIFSASQALEQGLVDRTGSLQETIAALEQRLGVPGSRVVAYVRPNEWQPTIYDRGPGAPVLQLDLSQLFGWRPSPGFHYLWWPGGR